MIGAHGRDTWDADLERRRCTADAKGKLRGGAQPGTDEARCGNRPIPGGTTCRFHGSGTAAARRTARLRLAELVDPAVVVLGRALADPDATHADKIRAAEAVLDRSGYPRRHQIDVDAGRERIAERIAELRRENP